MQVGHTLKMLAWSCLNVDSSDGQTRNVSVDVFLIHSRLMCELLLVRPARRTTDFSVLDFCVNLEPTGSSEAISRIQWKGPNREAKSLLLPLWNTASKHVVHFSRERAPEYLRMIEPEDFTAPTLRRLTLAIFSLLDDFLVFEETNSPEETSRGAHQLRSELTWATDILNGGQDELGPLLPSL